MLLLVVLYLWVLKEVRHHLDSYARQISLNLAFIFILLPDRRTGDRLGVWMPNTTEWVRKLLLCLHFMP